MRLSDIQPQYFPRLHYFSRMLSSDVFIIRDDVQFVRHHRFPDGSRGVSHQAHTPIKGPDGVHLLTVPVKKGSYQPINRTGVSHEHSWDKKHSRAIHSFYASSPNMRALVPEIEQLLHCRFQTVADLDIATMCWALGHVLGERLRIPEELSIDRMNELLDAKRATRLRRIMLGSELLGPESYESSSASARIVTLCTTLGADEYMAGGTARQAYLDEDLLRRNGIELSIQSWSCPTYQQQHMARHGFIGNLSILDPLMNLPAEAITGLLESDHGTQQAGATRKKLMDIIDYNRSAWDREVERGNKWTVPVSPEEVARARSGD